MLESFDFHYLPAETRNFLEWRIKIRKSCGKASGSPTRVFPRILGPGVTFAMAAYGLLCFRSMPNSVLIPHRYQQCLHSIKAFSVTLLPQWRGWACARCCEETQLGHHLVCFAWESYDRSTSFKLNLVIWALCYCSPVRCGPVTKQPYPLDTAPVTKHTTALVEDSPKAVLWPHLLTTVFRVRVYSRCESQEWTSDGSKASVNPSWMWQCKTIHL